MDDVTRLLADLVAIPSVNPMGRVPPPAGALEGRTTEYLEHFLSGLGVSVTRRAVAPGRENVLARFDSPGARRTLIFDAHQDTVPTDGMTIDPFRPDIVGDRLHGRGSCDVKGGMAAMLTAFARLVRERPAGAASVVMACTVDEEYTHLGSSDLADHGPRADLAIVAEPTMLNVINTHKGAVRWKIRTSGIACHSSTPQLGDNAIYRMARIVSALAEYAGELAQSPPDPVLGPPSLSIGRIEGGQSVNIVPDWCEIQVDRRVIPGEEPSSCPGRVADFLAEKLRGLDRIEFLPPWVNMPALRPNVPAETVETVRSIIAGVTGRAPEVGGVPFGTDAGPLGQAGIPGLVLGPGDIAQAHTKDEWIELDQVRQAAEIYYRIAVALG